jgi:hypothetical protein
MTRFSCADGRVHVTMRDLAAVIVLFGPPVGVIASALYLLGNLFRRNFWNRRLVALLILVLSVWGVAAVYPLYQLILHAPSFGP